MTNLRKSVFTSLSTLIAALILFVPGWKAAAAQGTSLALYRQLACDRDIPPYTVSRDGRWLAVGCLKSVRVWDLVSGLEVRRFPAQGLLPEAVGALTFTVDSKAVLFGDFEGRVQTWDLETGTVLRTYPDLKEEVTAVAVSPDGRLFAAVAGHKMTVFALATGEERESIDYDQDYVDSVAFLPDNQTIVLGGSEGVVTLWNMQTDARREIPISTAQFDSVRASLSDGGLRMLTMTYRSEVKVWDVQTGRVLRTLKDVRGDAALSPDGRSVLAGLDDRHFHLIDVDSGRELRVFPEQYSIEYDCHLAAFFPDGKGVLMGDAEGSYVAYDVRSGALLGRHEERPDNSMGYRFSLDALSVYAEDEHGKQLWNLSAALPERKVMTTPTGPEGPHETTQIWNERNGKFYASPGRIPTAAALLSPDGSLTAGVSSKEHRVYLFDRKTDKELRHVTGTDADIVSLVYSPDSRSLVAGSADGTVLVWKASTGQELHRLNTGSIPDALAVSPDGQVLAVSGRDAPSNLLDKITGSTRHGWVTLWDLPTGRQISRIAAVGYSINKLVFAPDGKRLLTGGGDASVSLWDVGTGRQLMRFAGPGSNVTALAMTSDGQTAAAAYGGELTYWDVASGRLKASLLLTARGDWAVVDGEGRYDSSDPDHAPGLHFVAGLEPIDLRQLKQRFYYPQLLSRVLQGATFDPIAALKELKPAPDVVVVAPREGSATATLRLANRGGGLGRLLVRVNGREVPTSVRGNAYPAEAASAEIQLDLRGATLLPGGENVIEVSAFNADNTLQSRGFRADWKASRPQDTQPPQMYLIVAGVSTFANPGMNLHYAAKDAVDIGKVLRLAATGLYSDPARVHATILASGTGLEPTKANLRAAFEEVARKARPQDLLVVYFAGHGMASRLERDQYFFFTAEATSLEVDRDAALREATTISSAELRQWLYRQDMPLKQVLILDTCAAGAALGQIVNVSADRALSPDQVRAIELLKDATGSWILMGSAADAVSYEANRYAQGLVTYALLEGMKGSALDGDRVEVGKLLGFAQREVEDLAHGIGGVQRPILSAPMGQTYPIGILSAATRSTIHLASTRPLLMPPRVLGEDDLDALGLEPALRNALAIAAMPAMRGGTYGQAPLVYLDSVAGNVPDALTPLVRYTVRGGRIALRVRLLKNGVTTADWTMDLAAGDAAAIAGTGIGGVGEAKPGFKIGRVGWDRG